MNTNLFNLHTLKAVLPEVRAQLSSFGLNPSEWVTIQALPSSQLIFAHRDDREIQILAKVIRHNRIWFLDSVELQATFAAS